MSYRIRNASVADAPVILRFITELAEYEKAVHKVVATVETLAETMFGPKSVTKAVICETDAGEPVGFAVWFVSFSTWQARNVLSLEDLYVVPEHRGGGVGRTLLRHLAQIAVAEGYGRFEWNVLDWNAPAIRVYESIGAEPKAEWIRYRLAGDKLKAFAES